MKYKFNVGDKVRYVGLYITGEITSTVPGNGSIEWYFVTWADGTTGRYTRDELDPD